MKDKYLIEANSLQIGDKVLDNNDVAYIVIANDANEALVLESYLNSTTEHIHLYYDDIEDVVYAKDEFGIDLKGGNCA